MNLQRYTLNFKKAEEPEIKLLISVGSYKNQSFFPKNSTPASWTTLKPLTMWITTNWKIPKEMGIPDHLTCPLRNLYSGQETTVKMGHGRTDWFKN